MNIEVLPLVAGECLNVAALTELGGPWRVRAYPAGCVLIRHPVHGAVLFDTGYGAQVLAAMRRWPGVIYGLVTPVRLRPEQTALAQLQRLGINAEDLQHIIVSHLHADHVGALRDFPSARFLLDPAAYRPLQGLTPLKAIRRAFLPELLPDDFEARCDPLQFQPAPSGLAPFSDAADVFGDGSIYALPVPGHAPGMIALVIRTTPHAMLNSDGTGLTLLASDAAWSVRALRQNLEVHPLARRVFWDIRQEQRSRFALFTWLRAHPRATVMVSHDLPERALNDAPGNLNA